MTDTTKHIPNLAYGDLVRVDGVLHKVVVHYANPDTAADLRFVRDEDDVRRARDLDQAAAIETLRDSAVLGDALGYLWMHAPARRDEIRALCLATGLTATVDQ